jgi:23S rRNA (cytidine1920-2'-O)/16S rRNA (cytidine1409-2'-O)-methyltransferase
MIRQRLDEALVARMLYPSRARSRDAVLRGLVQVDGEPARKPSQMVLSDAKLTITDEGSQYVSRAALKLVHALDHFNINVEGRTCLDIGASTGGFTEVLLERGAKHVFAIDVGHSQMMLRDDRITLHEGLNARDLEADYISEEVSLITCDVSFIPLRIALPAALDLMKPGADIIALIKPQFEVGKDGVGKGGIVKDKNAYERVNQEVSDFLTSSGWSVQGLIPSPMEGGDGNLEFLIAAQKITVGL